MSQHKSKSNVRRRGGHVQWLRLPIEVLPKPPFSITNVLSVVISIKFSFGYGAIVRAATSLKLQFWEFDLNRMLWEENHQCAKQINDEMASCDLQISEVQSIVRTINGAWEFFTRKHDKEISAVAKLQDSEIISLVTRGRESFLCHHSGPPWRSRVLPGSKRKRIKRMDIGCLISNNFILSLFRDQLDWCPNDALEMYNLEQQKWSKLYVRSGLKIPSKSIECGTNKQTVTPLCCGFCRSTCSEWEVPSVVVYLIVNYVHWATVCILNEQKGHVTFDTRYILEKTWRSKMSIQDEKA